MSEPANISGGEVAHTAGRKGHAAHSAIEADILVIGAGATGLYQLYRARTEGFSVLLLDAGAGVGEASPHHRSPAAPAAADSPGHFFPAEPGGPRGRAAAGAGRTDAERRLNDLIDRHGLRRDMRCGAMVDSAVFEEPSATWSVRTVDATEYRARFVVAAARALPASQERGVADQGAGERPVRDESVRRDRRHGPGARRRTARYGPSPGPVAPRRPVCRRVTGAGTGSVEATEEGAAGLVADGARAAAGALKRLGVRGRDGLRLAGYWADGPRTYLGLMTAGFPNFFFPGGPYAPLNTSRDAGEQVDFVTGALLRARDRGRQVIEVGLEAEDAWTNLMSGGTRLLAGSGGGPPRGRADLGGLSRYAWIGPGEDFVGLLAATLDDEYAALIFS